MHRFFVLPDNIDKIAKKIYITEPEARHIEKVLRLRAGERIIAFDGSGWEYLAIITGMDQGFLVADIECADIIDREPVLNLQLIQSIARGDKMELIIQKAVELGVSKIYPLLSEHTVVKLEGEKTSRKVQRWQAIAREACKQCRRNTVPEIMEPLQFNDLIILTCDHPALMLYENEAQFSLRMVLQDIRQRPDFDNKIFLVVGPEGGFAETEINQARRHNILTASLGPRILRTETAGLVAASIIMYEFGELGGRVTQGDSSPCHIRDDLIL